MGLGKTRWNLKELEEREKNRRRIKETFVWQFFCWKNGFGVEFLMGFFLHVCEDLKSREKWLDLGFFLQKICSLPGLLYPLLHSKQIVDSMYMEKWERLLTLVVRCGSSHLAAHTRGLDEVPAPFRWCTQKKYTWKIALWISHAVNPWLFQNVPRN